VDYTVAFRAARRCATRRAFHATGTAEPRMIRVVAVTMTDVERVLGALSGADASQWWYRCTTA
jgi:hypothetical protein